jgi:hypothetical protein
MNRLAGENSLYLRQHADNPVDWWPWGAAALAEAHRLDKPLLVSIGYSACHWCHVMAHESFADPAIARLMNTHFICIKVDREEHPEVDRTYMAAVQMLHGHGGWPLNVFCLPDGRPFAGGTYFPPDERRGHAMLTWPQLLMRVADHYRRRRAELADNAAAILHNLAAGNLPVGDADDTPGAARALLLPAAQAILARFDAEYGGFGDAPKFPPCQALEFLLALRATAAVERAGASFVATLDKACMLTLDAMARGGLYDQIGGGFARYSVDRQWRIPHFEKMLYDNALLLDIYGKAWRRYRNPLFAAVIGETIAWLQREMLAEEACKSALDADSEGGEGNFYVWTPAAVRAVLGDEAAAFCDAYAITAAGNFEDGRSQPALLEPDFSAREAWRPAREQLLAARALRPRPADDPKQLTAWNALLARALAEAAFSFGRTDWWDAAARIGNWLWERMRTPDGRLHSLAYGREPTGTGGLDDHAFALEAVLALAAYGEWHTAGSGRLWLERARQLAEVIHRDFADAHAPGYFTTIADHPLAVHRAKDWYDDSTSAGNSSLLHSFNALHILTGEAHWAAAAERLRGAYAGVARQAPQAAAYALSAMTQEAMGLAVLRLRGVADLEPLRQAIVARPWRRIFLVNEDPASGPHGYQLCVGTQCLPATNDPQQLAEQLA